MKNMRPKSMMPKTRTKKTGSARPNSATLWPETNPRRNRLSRKKLRCPPCVTGTSFRPDRPRMEEPQSVSRVHAVGKRAKMAKNVTPTVARSRRLCHCGLAMFQLCYNAVIDAMLCCGLPESGIDAVIAQEAGGALIEQTYLLHVADDGGMHLALEELAEQSLVGPIQCGLLADFFDLFDFRIVHPDGFVGFLGELSAENQMNRLAGELLDFAEVTWAQRADFVGQTEDRESHVTRFISQDTFANLAQHGVLRSFAEQAE